MIRLLFLVLLGGFLNLPAEAADAFDHGLLWRVDSPGAPPSYLYGTMHSGDERVLKLAPAVRRAFDHSRRFAIELLSDEEAINRFRAAMVSREPRLASLLGQDYEKVDALLGERGVSRRARGHFKPWAALLVLAEPPETAGIILDQVLLLDAQRRGKPVTQLESIDDQIAALDGMDEATQLNLLRHVAKRQDEIAQAVAPLTEDYLKGDLAGMWRVNLRAMGDDPEVAADNQVFLDRLLFQRSARFADNLVPLLRKGGVFAAFGAMHLYGEHGVPALLAKQGFRVRPVRVGVRTPASPP